MYNSVMISIKMEEELQIETVLYNSSRCSHVNLTQKGRYLLGRPW